MTTFQLNPRFIPYGFLSPVVITLVVWILLSLFGLIAQVGVFLFGAGMITIHGMFLFQLTKNSLYARSSLLGFIVAHSVVGALALFGTIWLAGVQSSLTTLAPPVYWLQAVLGISGVIMAFLIPVYTAIHYLRSHATQSSWWKIGALTIPFVVFHFVNSLLYLGLLYMLLWMMLPEPFLIDLTK